jgi:hypothetical protein
MRRSRLCSVLALALLVAPAGSRLQGAVEPVSGPAEAAVTRTVAAPAGTARPLPRPSVKPVARPSRKPATRRATVVPPARAGTYAFLHLDAGQPVRWNPCAPVPWTFNPKGAPAGGLAAVRAAFAELSRQTGLTFAHQGTTAEVPASGYLRQGWKSFRPLLVGWTSAAESDLLAGRSRSTVGMARVLWTGSYDGRGANRTQIASGVVAFNTATTAKATGSGSWYTYALHELGHAVGLGHVDDAKQIMNPTISSSLSTYGTGDVLGLRGVGRSAGCLPAVR